MTNLGTDLDLGTDLSPTMGVVSGRKGLAQAILRRLSTRRGQLERHPTYGIDVPSYLSDTLDVPALARLRQQIAAQCLDDERVRRVDVTVEAPTPRSLRITLSLTDGAGPFRLVLAARGLTLSLLSGS